jgi:hypothetical protein
VRDRCYDSNVLIRVSRQHWTRTLLACAAFVAGCEQAPDAHADRRQHASLGQWVWTRADVSRYTESLVAHPTLEAGVFIGAIHCDTVSLRLVAQAGLSPAVVPVVHPTAVIRLEDGLDRCRNVSSTAVAFEPQLDSAVRVLRQRGGNVPYAAVQLDYDAPQRALAGWAASVRYLGTHALVGDTVWITSIIAHLREPAYGALFSGAVRGHVLQVFDTGEPATPERIAEAVRVARRAGMAFRVGLGAFERETSRGRTQHRAWFDAVPQFSAVQGFEGVWIFPAGNRWVTLFREML